MTTLVTEGGQLLRTEGPYQLTAGGRRSLAQSSVPFSTWAGGGHLELLGEGQTVSYAQLYRKQPWVAVMVNKLSRQIARLPLKVYELNSQGDRERVREGRLVDLLRTPYPRAGPVHLKQKIAFPVLLHGNGLLLKYRAERGGPPSELFPLDWRFVTAHAADGGPIEFWETTQTGERRFLDVEDSLHFAWESPDADVGVSPLQQLGVTLKLEDAAQRYATSAFGNAARPSGAFVLPPEAKLNREDREELRGEIERRHSGVDNAFRMLLLSGGADWKALSHTAHEAELIEQRKLNREEAAAVYDLPPPLIGILDHATFSNVQEMHRMLYETVLGPWLTLLEETLQAQLIDPEPAFQGQFVEFDLGEVLKGDRTKETGALKLAVHAGLMTINEARQVLNLPRVDHPLADQPLVPANNLSSLSGVDGPDEAEVEKAIRAAFNGDADEERVKRALASLSN